MTEAEFRKKAEAIKERYSKFVFYFDKRQKKNFGLALSDDSICSSLFDENILSLFQVLSFICQKHKKLILELNCISQN